MERFDDSGDGMLDRKELKVILDLLSELEQEEDGGAGTDSDLEMDPNEWRKLSLKERMAFSRKGYHPR